MQLRSAPQGPLFTGTAPGDLLVWNGSEWLVKSASAGGVLPAFVFDQNSTAYTQVSAAPTIVIATATIQLRANSSVLVQATTTLQGSVAPGRAFISCAAIPGANGSQSFDATTADQFRTLNFLGIVGPQPAGAFTLNLNLDVSGNVGAQVDSSGTTCLTLTEIPA